MKQSTRIRWARRVAQWKKSGQTAEAFAAKIGTTPATLSFYKWQLNAEQKRDGRRNRKRSKKAAPQFVELMSAITPDAPVEIETGGVVVRVRNGFDETTLKRVLDLVRAAK